LAKETILNSVNVSVLESRIVTDTCNGFFFIDLTPTVYLLSGNLNVLGAKIEITNPYGVKIRAFQSTFDIAPPMTSVFQFGIPTQGGLYQLGVYVITIQLTDANGNVYDISDNVKVCQPNPLNKRDKYGIIHAEIEGSCKTGAVRVLVDEPPIHQGAIYESKIQSYTLKYPTSLAPLVTDQPSFEVELYEGEYKLEGDLCVTYHLGNNQYSRVPFKVNCAKTVRCKVDKCIIYEKLGELGKELSNEKCKDKEYISNVILSAISLIVQIDGNTECGKDASKYIIQLESLLGCSCSCRTAETPVTIGTPSGSIVINGCNVSSVDAGLTKIYTIDNYEFVTTINPANGTFVAIAPPTLGGCTKTQELTFNVAALYGEIKNQVSGATEFNYWAGVVNNTLNGISANLLTCLGLTAAQWDASTLRQKMVFWLEKMCACCGTATCNAVVSKLTAALQGVQTLLSWENDANVGSVDIYVDDNFVDNVLNPSLVANSSTYLLSGYNDGVQHRVKIVAKCDSGINGNSMEEVFTHAGCPTILPPTLTVDTIASAACPFNLNTILASAPPVGTVVEWHTANNTNVSTLISDPTLVTSGTYYAFHKNGNGCYSTSSVLQVNCATVGNCTEPLSLLVQKQ
jgi:hypothetical protein